MNKKKLKLEKFTIAKLNNSNSHKVIGGVKDDDATIAKNTRPLVCVRMSDLYVPEEETVNYGVPG